MKNFLYVVQYTIQFKISIFNDVELFQQQTAAFIGENIMVHIIFKIFKCVIFSNDSI